MLLFFTTMITEYLQACWLQPKEIELYLCIFQYWPKTATQLAQRSWIERTNCYKVIQQLVEKWIVQSGEKNGVKQFWVSKTSSIKDYLESKKNTLEKLEQKYDEVQFEFDKLRSYSTASLPKIRLYEQSHGIKNLHESILQSIKLQWCKIIQVYMNNVFEASWSVNKSIQDSAQEFYKELDKQGLKIQARKGSGMSLIEEINYSESIWSLADFSHGSWSAQLWIIWEDLYIIIYKDIPIGMKVQNKEVAYMIFSLLQKGNF